MPRRLRPRGIITVALLSSALGAPAIAQELTLTRVSWAVSPDGAEITAFDPETSRLFTTGDTGISVFNFEHDGSLTLARRIDLSGVFGRTLGVSSIAVDPLARGFGLAAVIPADNTSRRGKIIAFSVSTGEVIASFESGFHSDMVCFTRDGRYALVADEGEATPESDAPGGITVIDLTAVTSASDLLDARPMTLDFPRDLDPLVSLDKVRPTFEGSGELILGIEPEYIAPDEDGAWVALQENNALARFDFATMRFTDIRSLGVIEQTIDASDRDGAALVDDTIATLPMPDSIGSYTVDGRRYIVTVNEGETRGEEMRFARAVERGLIDPATLAALDAAHAGDAASESALGRLEISTIDGDIDGDGDIDRLHAFGSRSFSIIDIETGVRVFDSGSEFERITAERQPLLFNAESDPGSFDGRSDNRGPEPEGLAIASIEGRVIAFIGLERAGAIVAYDITVPTEARIVAFVSTFGEEGHGIAPEGLCFVERSSVRYLVVSSESSRTVEVFRIDYR
jgi:hypothetical protein